ncbi:MAG: glutamine synthetase type III [Candidatus Eisenbacteria bacterium]|uniref:Glutamine synthetase type III n=1 Tax=Eiseniibacteriota bacterium TaxID=2212470 RepID=A0A849STE0_UNCEI|nr:glutamine synthetase type III [Candidatus Eisenbacteria bacterium]
MSALSRHSARLSPNRREPRAFSAPRQPDGNRAPVSSYFASHVLDLIKLKERLPREAYQALLVTLKNGGPLARETAETIASVAREWATSQGATHFTHWFQPMTGLTAEKHDAFIDLNFGMRGELKVLERFSGSMLLQGEPDASSFPSGGIRSTFEARGYTAWDPSSPMFLMESTNGRTLCVPTVFIAYHGESLDHKTPLLRSLDALDKQALEFLKLLGDVDVQSVSATLGVEQEYFLIDRDHFVLRPDLVMCERTLLGAASARGQQFEDHYFGSIPPRVLAFMEEMEFELHRLGIPIKTRHNEVAPMQFEFAPIFEDANIANDHNALAMDVARRVAMRHHLAILFHEKPFDGLNGSGKHCNWSLGTDRGDNLFDPGRTPHQNLRFLAFLAVFLKAVHDHADVLRYSIAYASNDLRLGANEAPPAILSVFMGDQLTNVIEKITSGARIEDPQNFVIQLGVGRLPQLMKDNTDRNRTSPFAFTGNKFEFRAVGSNANCAGPLTMLAAAVADSLRQLSPRLNEKVKKGGERDKAVLELLREVYAETAAVRFEGNGYSDEWKTEAARRGLPNLVDTPSVLAALQDPKRTAFLNELGIFTEREQKGRMMIALERYLKTVELEADTLIEMLNTFVIPAGERQLSVSLDVLRRLEDGSGRPGGVARPAMQARTDRIAMVLGEVIDATEKLSGELDKVDSVHDELDKARKLADAVRPGMAAARSAADRLEHLVDDSLWTLPKYREMLFVK